MLTGIFIIAGLIILVVFAAWLLYRNLGNRKLAGLRLKLLLIKLPAEEDESKSEANKEINKSEQLFSSLLSLEVPFVFEASVHNIGEEIHFYVAVPEERTNFVARQIQGLFLDSQVDLVKDYNIFSPGNETASAYLTLRDSYVLPLRTYEESEVDTFAQILSNLSKIEEAGEGASIQVTVAPARKGAKGKLLEAIGKLKKGGELDKILKAETIELGSIKDTLGPAKKKEEDKLEPKTIDDEAIKAIQGKVDKPLFSVNVRVIASARTESRAEDILLSVAGAYAGVTAPLRNEIVVHKSKRKGQERKLNYQYSFREFDESQAMILSSEELASIFHLPTAETDVPHVKWLKSKEAPPPENLPNEGVVIGESVFRGDKKLVRQGDDDRRRHFYVVGQTGTGKSYLMLNMAVQDMQMGKGLCVIDPHGELVNDILERVPESRVEDVIVFDPGDTSRPLGMNMLEYDPSKPEHKSFIVNEMQAIFNKIFEKQPEGLGPMFQQYMRNTLLLLMEDAANEPATLIEVPRVMTDAEFRRKKLARINNPVVIDFWEKEAAKATGESSLSNMAPYITTKFGSFISNDYMRPIIGQTESAFDFRRVMDEGKILLVNLSKGKIGDINANLLGMVISGRILMAALSREDTDKAHRRDFYFYIDEFQNFTTDSISTILSEARKYKLNLILAHQFIAQLSDNIRESVFGNVGSLASFRVGVPDTETLVKQFGPEFNEKDLISIENRNAYAKLLIDGEPSKPFNIRTRNAVSGSSLLAEKLKELSRLTYGRDKSQIEQEILRRLRS